VGVTAQTNVDRYNALVRHKGREVYGGGWPTAELAAIARDRMVLHFALDRPLNLPARSRRLGPASPETLRREARQLTKRRRNARSPYFGVNLEPRGTRWQVRVWSRGREILVGTFKDPAIAARVRDAVLIHLRQREPTRRRELLNFPEARTRPLSLDQARRLAEPVRKVRYTSRFVGVSLDSGKSDRPWAARVHGAPGLGRYRTERDAAIARDRAALYYRGPTAKLNLPKQSRPLGPASAETLRAAAFRVFKSQTRSRFRGIAPTSAGRWCAVVHHNKQRHYLGVFDTEEEAAAAYDRAAKGLKDKPLRLNFHPTTGEELCGQWFGLKKPLAS
jgi:hypothetical protein